MTFADIVGIAATIVASLGGGGLIVFGLSNYLGKLWADRALEKQRHEHSRLNLEFTHQLGLVTEQVKSSLQMAALEHEVRFSELYKKRADVIADVYSRLADARKEGKRFIVGDAYLTDPQKQQEAWQKIAKMLDEVFTFIDKHRIYLPEHICALLQQLSDHMWQHASAVSVYAPLAPATQVITAEKHEALCKAYEAYFSEEIPAITRALEDEFRKLLGVETTKASTASNR